ncbi:hypothetical protein BCD67_00955 [Oscillatoriales cyanobacterium USR001]|nr:hypothetical protein BCD67_00955 [Oscillatoriales cyanobacterium USR001]
MPQADLPGNQHPHSPAIEPDAGELPPTLTSSAGAMTDNFGEPKEIEIETLANTLLDFLERSEDDWETVNFPDAIDVDAIPKESIVEDDRDRETTELFTQPKSSDPTSAKLPFSVRDRANTIHFSAENIGKIGAPTTLVQALHECNRDLVQRIAELEAALEESQKALQAKEALIEQQNAEISGAQEQVTRLFGKQEQVNEIIQRQEVLIETLTEQLQTSQTRLAVIERECALIQQRYSTQQNLLVRTENSCRELRSRLHRQQRHTLQFKAALERYLEMPHLKLEAKNQLSENSDRDPNSESETFLDPIATEKVQTTEVQLIPQTSPVKPWSAPAEKIPNGLVSEEPKITFLQDRSAVNTSVEVPSNPLPELETYWHIESVTENPFQSAALEEEEEEVVKINEWEGVEEPTFSVLTETSNPENHQLIAEVNFVEKPDWIASITYSQSTTKKRRSLAEIELPSFR